MNRTLKSELYGQIFSITNMAICKNDGVYNAFLERLEKGMLTRDEDSKAHFCAYFLPFNPENKKFFIVHHKKSGLWLSPGGHIDAGETLLEALNREIKEELGLECFFKEPQTPFLLTVTPINHPTQPCKEHFDIWYSVPTDGGGFNIDPREFHNTQWMTIGEAKEIVTDPANLDALKIISR